MQELHFWLAAWEADHRDPANRLIHGLCLPLMLLAIAAALWTVPVPALLGRQGLWAAAAMIFLFAWYQRLSRPLAFAMASALFACALACEGLWRWLDRDLLYAAAALFVLAWIGRAIGYQREGHWPRPGAMLAYIVIGPAWLCTRLLQRLKIDY